MVGDWLSLDIWWVGAESRLRSQRGVINRLEVVI